MTASREAVIAWGETRVYCSIAQVVSMKPDDTGYAPRHDVVSAVAAAAGEETRGADFVGLP